MCGICGIYSLDKSGVNQSLVKRMNDQIIHRGPDDEGYWLSQNSVPFIALASRRLSIIDLSAAGHQPMANEDKTLWITYNGEIYNYLELKQELENFGHKFNSDSDTEVILHAYEQWGTECLRRFNGMWAFVLWDSRNKRLFCARDYFGIKPFYYYHDKNIFVFASEIKAILAHPAVAKKINHEILYDYLTTGYVDHSEDTFFAGIKHLKSSHYMLIDSKNNATINKWWNIEAGAIGVIDKGANEHDVVSNFRDLLEDSVRIRLRSDVPVGTCLSGGLDSSSIVCLINRLLLQHKVVRPELIGAHQKTFSACYDDKRVDEQKFMNMVIQQTAAESHKTFPSSKELWNDLSKLIWHQEEPFRSTSIYAQFCVMKLVSQNKVKVLLDGQGADELLAGYFNYPAILLNSLISKGDLSKAFYEWRHSIFSTPYQKVKLLLFIIYSRLPSNLRSLARSSLAALYQESSVKSKPFAVREDWAIKFKGRINSFYEARYKYTNDLNRTLYSDTLEYGLPALLRYEDKNSSAFSLEARVPFLDHRFVEFCFSLSYNYKIRDGLTKWILRESMKGVIPKEIALRRDKIGFATPEVQWLAENRDNIKNLFKGSKVLCGEFIMPDKVFGSIDSMLSRDTIKFTDIWRWVNLEMWLRAFFG
ncbi:MAG: asparagine synthase (glutamine-hydrolyzing) [Candidatus Brocadiia bacterium]